MLDINILYFLLFVILSLLVIANTYNIYRLSNIDYKKRSLMDMSEFDDLHPMLKELYQEAVVNGVFVIQNIMLNDIVKMNNIDKWYNANKKDVFELIEVIKEYGKAEIVNNKNAMTIDPHILSKFYSFDIKKLVVNMKIALEEEKKKIN
jgi:hypothetical protein